MGAVVAALASSEPFWHQLVITVVSAVLTAAGLILAAVVTTRRVNESTKTAKENQQMLKHISRAVATDRREDDPHP